MTAAAPSRQPDDHQAEHHLPEPLPPEPLPPDDRVAVVVITWNRRDEVLSTLARIRELPERPAVVVVDNASSDGTADAIAARFPDVSVVRSGRNLGGAGRNLGVARVQTPYVAFCDDDSWPAPGSLARAADLLDRFPRLAVVTGRILVGDAERVDPMSEEMAASPLPRPGDAPGAPLLSFLAGASTLRRSAFEEAGGFDPRIGIGGEEEHLAADLASAGWAMSYVDEVVWHHHASAQRDPHLRRRQGVRNALWFTWSRRRGWGMATRTWDLLRSLPRDRVTLAGLGDAVRGLPWVLRSRQPVPPSVERGYRTLQPSQRTSRARRYVS